MRKLLLGSVAVVALATGGAANAADMVVKAPVYKAPPCGWSGEVGLRAYGSSGKTEYDLYRIPPTSLISRLTYTGLQGGAGEVFGRVDDDCYGFFVKGYAGWGSINRGNLQDEDFPPGIPGGVYSSTNSEQRDGRNRYFTADAGWNFWRGAGFKIGGFVGVHHYYENVNAYGCAQTAGNPAICVPTVPTSTLVISQETRWNAVRVGVNGVWRATEALKFTGEAAWVPYARLDARDTHWLRLGAAPGNFNGPTPQDGNGYGVMLEGIASYNLTPAFAVGVGARYERIQTKDGGGTMHFETSVVGGGGAPQNITFITERYGAFLQASYTFGTDAIIAKY